MRERLPFSILTLALALPAQLPDLPAASLEGVVVDPMQRPVAGAQVVVEVDGEERARTQSNGEGTFVVGKLPQGVVTVRATTMAPDIGGASIDLIGLDRRFVRIVLLPARKVAGTVRDDAGKAVASAWVVGAPQDGIDFAHAAIAAQADVRGHYELTHVPFGRAVLRAWAPGCDAGEATIDGNGDVQHDLVVQTDGIDVQTFQLLGADAAQCKAARLVVTASCKGVPVPLPPPLRRLRPDEQGVVTVTGWPRDDVIEARFTLPGALVTPPRHATNLGVNDAHWRYHVGRSDECIRGRLASNGLPLGGRLVLVQPLSTEGSLVRLVGRTAPDGSFTLPSPVDRGLDFALRLWDGDATVAGPPSDPCWYVASHDPIEHHVKIAPAACARVRVLTSTGEPAAGAEVLLFRGLKDARQNRGLDALVCAYGELLGRGTTDLEGNATLAGLQFEVEDRLSCVVLGAQGWAEVVTTAPETRLADFLEVALQRGADLDCLVVDGSGQPAPGGRMHIRSDRSIFYTSQRLIAGRDGHVLVTGLPPGSYVTSTSPPRQSRLLNLTAGANATIVD